MGNLTERTELIVREYEEIVNAYLSSKTLNFDRLKYMSDEDMVLYAKTMRLLVDCKDLAIAQAEMLDNMSEKIDLIYKRVK